MCSVALFCYLQGQLGGGGVVLPHGASVAIQMAPMMGSQVLDEDMAAQIAAQITCEECGKPAMFVCSACKSVAYCSPLCQVRLVTRLGLSLAIRGIYLIN